MLEKLWKNQQKRVNLEFTPLTYTVIPLWAPTFLMLLADLLAYFQDDLMPMHRSGPPPQTLALPESPGPPHEVLAESGDKELKPGRQVVQPRHSLQQIFDPSKPQLPYL